MNKNGKNDLEFDKKMQQLSLCVYEGNEQFTPKDCECISEYEDRKTGFYAKAFRMGNKIVISIRGTEFTSKKDLNSDIQMNNKKIPEQFESALKFYNSIEYKFKEKGYEIVITGHSLGGSLTQLLCHLTGCRGVTFNAYGVGDYVRSEYPIKSEEGNIKNYGNINDYTFGTKIDSHIGQVYVIETNKDEKFLRPIKYHKIENMGSLDLAEAYDKRKHNKLNEKQKNPSKIFLIEDLITTKVGQKYQRVLRNIIEQAKKGNILSEQELNEKIKSGEVHVNSYVKEDGTHVREYYRSYPHFA